MLKIGSVIDGKYKILNIVGKGGMSIVYLAMNEKVNKQWAIKEILKKDYRNFDMDKKEIEMMKRLKHPNLPAIVDVIEQKDSMLIVMDYIEGQSLEDIVSSYGPQNEKQVIVWAKQLCGVLHYLHTRTPPIIYRDMKPSNVMLRPDGRVMLIDFGAAREYKTNNLKDTVLLGTRGYAAPEQYRSDGQSDERTDLYSLGVTVFRLLSGAAPQELCPIRELVPEISPGIEKILLKCTRVIKNERYQTAAELLEAFQRYWEYDEQFWKVQKKKLISFLIPTMLSLLFLVCFILFSIRASKIKKNNYEAFLIKAEQSHLKEDALEFYHKAIRLNPKKEEAYLLMLKSVFLQDGQLSAEENRSLRNILNSYHENGHTYETLLQSNEKGYALFSYELGITYFYKYEDKENKKSAKWYFQTAASSEKLEERKRKRAQRLGLIAGYYDQVGIVDEAGDVIVSFEKYWKDLILAREGNLVEEDNERTAMVVYKEMISQILSRTTDFQRAEIPKEELLQEIRKIEKHLKEDFQNSDEEVQIAEELEELKKHVKIAKNMITSVYGQTE